MSTSTNRTALRRAKRAALRAADSNGTAFDVAREHLRHGQAKQERYLRGTPRPTDGHPFVHNKRLPPNTTLGLPARPAGVSRQVHRAGFRAACKAVGVDYRDLRERR